ncbi:MAG: NfeD family protein [Candidatus Latescibacterota bacterium]
MAWVYALALLVLGFLLVLLEVFVVPGFNIFGVIGFAVVCVGVVYAYAELGVWPAAAAAVLAAAGTVVVIRLLARARAWHRLVLQSDVSRQSGYDAATPGREALLGQLGETVSALRPAGRARFGTDVVDVVSEGGFIDRGEAVQVLRLAGNSVVVRRAAEGAVAGVQA